MRHAKQIDIVEGRSTEGGTAGNGFADELQYEGIKHHLHGLPSFAKWMAARHTQHVDLMSCSQDMLVRMVQANASEREANKHATCGFEEPSAASKKFSVPRRMNYATETQEI